MGVRTALGARSVDVLMIMLKEGMTLAAIGILIGSLTALVLARLIAGMLFGIGAHDPVTFLSIVVVIAAACFLACYVPARRATKVDAVVALRSE